MTLEAAELNTYLSLSTGKLYIWPGRVLNSQLTNEELRNTGRCAFTPEEIGLFLVALGSDSRTQLCLALTRFDSSVH